jgi:hypothetical protein
MAIEVRIPTILRTYTGGAKAVEGSGATLDELLGNLDKGTAACVTGWSTARSCAGSSTSTSTTRTSASSAAWRPRSRTATR